MPNIYGIVSFACSDYNVDYLRILRNELDRYPHDGHSEIQIPGFVGGAFHYRLRKPPFPEEGIAATNGQYILADARLDYRRDLVDRLRLDSSSEMRLSDTELILKAYMRWGDECAVFLEGDFSFFAYDSRNQRIFGARDPIGGRPLFYSRHAGRLYFSSSIQGLLRLPFVKADPDDDFWRNRFFKIPVGSDVTPHKGIKQLPPGETLKVSPDRVTGSSYYRWNLPHPGNSAAHGAYVEQLGELIERAVRSRLYNDYGIGGMLSGGLDSSAVLAVASRLQSQTIYATSSVVRDRSKADARDERRWVSLFKESFPSVEVRYMSYSGSMHYQPDFSAQLIDVRLRRFGAYFVESAMLNHLHNQGCRTFFTGRGGDQFISRDSSAPLFELLVTGNILSFITTITGLAGFQKTSSIEIIKRAWRKNKALLRYSAANPTLLPLLKPQWQDVARVPSNARSSHLARKMIVKTGEDLVSLLPTNPTHRYYKQNLYREPARAMARLNPLMDPRIINFSLGLPVEEWVKEGISRSIFRRAQRGILPEALRMRVTKGAFWTDTNQFYRGFLESLKSQVCISEIADSSPMSYIVEKDFWDKDPQVDLRAFTPANTAKLNLLGYLLYYDRWK